ncbi:hypothetical protein [Chitinophaga solisilvae]|uniref:hypothetical protein n=1 Tax=Chitinophaga solisilvae TaxID=1233460 RepID=UPI001369041E|nr:hypothetical protein [Chitinophaga solisilvae]
MEHFIRQYTTHHRREVGAIAALLREMGGQVGTQEKFFRYAGNGIYFLCDFPDHTLRLYCIRLGENLLLLGGGEKAVTTATGTGDSPEMIRMKQVSQDIFGRMSAGNVYWSSDKSPLTGDLIFEKDDT